MSVCLSVCMYVCMYVCLSVCLFMYLSIWLPIYLCTRPYSCLDSKRDVKMSNVLQCRPIWPQQQIINANVQFSARNDDKRPITLAQISRKWSSKWINCMNQTNTAIANDAHCACSLDPIPNITKSYLFILLIVAGCYWTCWCSTRWQTPWKFCRHKWSHSGWSFQLYGRFGNWRLLSGYVGKVVKYEYHLSNMIVIVLFIH